MNTTQTQETPIFSSDNVGVLAAHALGSQHVRDVVAGLLLDLAVEWARVANARADALSCYQRLKAGEDCVEEAICVLDDYAHTLGMHLSYNGRDVGLYPNKWQTYAA